MQNVCEMDGDPTVRDSKHKMYSSNSIEQKIMPAETLWVTIFNTSSFGATSLVTEVAVSS